MDYEKERKRAEEKAENIIHRAEERSKRYSPDCKTVNHDFVTGWLETELFNALFDIELLKNQVNHEK